MHLFDCDQLVPIHHGYSEDVFISCNKDITLRTFQHFIRKQFDPEKCPIPLKLPLSGNVSSKFENQINKAITSCFYAVKPHVVYNTRVMLSSAKNISTTQKVV